MALGAMALGVWRQWRIAGRWNKGRVLRVFRTFWNKPEDSKVVYVLRYITIPERIALNM
jgi:hypothetical protein